MKNWLQIFLQIFPFIQGLFKSDPIKKKARTIKKLNRLIKKGKITREQGILLFQEMGVNLKEITWDKKLKRWEELKSQKLEQT